MSELLLDVKNLSVSFDVFGGQLKVLDGVSLYVNKAEKIGLVGEMGCGKTTTVKSILRLLPTPPAVIENADIIFKGRNLSKLSHRDFLKVRKNEISMIFEDPTAALNPVFTIGTQVRDAVKHANDAGRKLSKKQLQQDAVKALEAVSLPDPERVLQFYPNQLSGGMRQRICIAMALVSANDLLIADEPDTSLDVTIKDQILRLLNDLVEQKNTSIILVSHALGAVRGMTDRVYVMYAGSVIETAKTKDLYKKPYHPYTQGLMASTPRLTGGGISKGIPGRIPEYMDPPKGCRFHPRCEKAMPICRERKPPEYTVGEEHRVACYLYQDK